MHIDFYGIDLDMHHLTYERQGHELSSDYIMICRRCHDSLHGKDHRWVNKPDPTKESPLLNLYCLVHLTIDRWFDGRLSHAEAQNRLRELKATIDDWCALVHAKAKAEREASRPELTINTPPEWLKN